MKDWTGDGNSIALPFWQWMLRRMCEISGALTAGPALSNFEIYAK